MRRHRPRADRVSCADHAAGNRAVSRLCLIASRMKWLKPSIVKGLPYSVLMTVTCCAPWPPAPSAIPRQYPCRLRRRSYGACRSPPRPLEFPGQGGGYRPRAVADVEHQCVGGALLGADRPAAFIGGQLGSVDLLALRPLNADRGIVFEPSLSDRVLDQEMRSFLMVSSAAPGRPAKGSRMKVLMRSLVRTGKWLRWPWSTRIASSRDA